MKSLNGGTDYDLVLEVHYTDTVIYAEDDSDPWNGVIYDKETMFRKIIIMAINRYCRF